MENTTALHEIGHYIAWCKYYALDFGMYDYTPDGHTKPIIESLSIHQDSDSLGRMLHDGSFYDCSPEIPWKILVAGYACEFIASGRNDTRHFLQEVIQEQKDFEGSDAYKLVDLICTYGSDIETVLYPVFIDVVAFLQIYWDLVLDYGRLLSDSGEISGIELHKMGEGIIKLFTPHQVG